jgi:predicted component of type VI protein secretion system
MAVFDEIKAANRRAQQRLKQTPTAVAARYDRKSGRVQVNLGAGMVLTFSPKNVEGLEHATPKQLSQIEISPSGFGLYFPVLDADLNLPALLEGVLGSKMDGCATWSRRRP